MAGESTRGQEREAVRARAQLVLRCRSHEEARVLWDAVRADDPGSVEGQVEDDSLVMSAGPAAMASLRVTIDDLLACVQAAYGAVTAGDPDDPVDRDRGDA